MKKFSIYFILMFLVLTASAQKPTPFNKGLNLTGWFQTDNVGGIHFGKYSKTDFEQVKSLGMDVVRLPISLHAMTSGEPDFIPNPVFLQMLDTVVGWAEQLDLHLIIDNHTFDPAVDTDPAIETALTKTWQNMALHYKDAYDKLYFEVLNEPHGISDVIWNNIQVNVVNAIREIDEKHTIIVGGANWNNYNNLDAIPEFTDDNLIYTFHFYDPFLFTHQGASWTDLGSLSGMPFPYNENLMPELPEDLKGSWVENQFNNYNTEGTAEAVKELIDIALNFAKERDVAIFCGEFGVLMTESEDDHRTQWYNVVSSYLTENNVGWTMWDYHGAFGLFESANGGLFEYDLNIDLVNAMDLTEPEQKEYMKKADTTALFLYTDFFHSDLLVYSSGDANYIDSLQPNNGSYSLSWTNAIRYNTINIDFLQEKDFSVLKDEDYGLDFIFRGTQPGISFDIRFVDTKISEEDHPWRMTTTISKSNTEWDSTWQHVHIPLTDFQETGSWDNDTWFGPAGEFDWTSIDYLQIVAENQDFGEQIIWLDNIIITDADTAQVYVDTPVQLPNIPTAVRSTKRSTYEITASQNSLIIFGDMPQSNFSIRDMLGHELFSGAITNQIIDISTLNSGVYFFIANNEVKQFVKK